MEYNLSRTAPVPPIFLFIVDTCQDQEGIDALKDSLLVSLSLLPPDALVGLVTFGRHIHLHEIGSTTNGGQKISVFNGTKEYKPRQIQEALGFLVLGESNAQSRPSESAMRVASRFLLPVQDAEFQLTNVLEQLTLDPFPAPPAEKRPLRSTGGALNLAISLLEIAYPNSASRAILFSAGPATQGGGKIVGDQFKDPLRSHHDIENDAATHYKAAKAFYDKLATRCARNGTIVDIFAGSYDQIGLDEMQHLARDTGGSIVLTDSFTTAIFKQSFLRTFNTDDSGHLTTSFSANLEVKVTRNLKVSGLVGHGIGLKNKNHQVAETEVGLGGTTSWKLCGVTPTSTVALVFDVPDTKSGSVLDYFGGSGGKTKQTVTGPGVSTQEGFIQLITHYLHSSGHYHLRVTTLRRAIALPMADISPSFDQEASATVIARIAVNKAESGIPLTDIIRWVDSTLVRVSAKFGSYVKGDGRSFKLPPQMSLFAQFMYHLRRSPILQIFNNSPDESTYYRHVFHHEDTNNSLIMVQPTLTGYSLDTEGSEPVLLDSTSLSPDKILLLDTFFHLLIWHGETIAAWRKAGYDKEPEYKNLADLLARPRQDVAELLQDRFPLPRFIDTDAGGSQGRFLLSRLNPTRSTTEFGSAVLTDDVSLQEFMESLATLAVTDK